MMILRSVLATRSLRRLSTSKDLKPLLSSKIRSLLLSKNLSLSLVFLLPEMVLSKRTNPDSKRETIRAKEVVAIEEAAEVEAASGVKPLDKLAVAAEVVNSTRDPELLTRLMLRATKLSTKVREEDQEAIEETRVIVVASMRATTNKMVPEEAVEVAERVETDLQEMLPLMMPRKRLRSRNPSKRSQRSLNLNMRKSFLVKTSMTISAPSRLLVARRLPDKLRRLMLLPRLRPIRRPIKLPSNRTPT